MSIQPTKFTTDASGRKRPARDTRWRVRFRTPEGEQREETFDTKYEAERFKAKLRTEIERGEFVDRAAGRVPLREYAQSWREAQMHRSSTAEQVEINLRRHVLPTFGDRALSSIRPSEVQAW